MVTLHGVENDFLLCNVGCTIEQLTGRWTTGLLSDDCWSVEIIIEHNVRIICFANCVVSLFLVYLLSHGVLEGVLF